MAKVYFKTIQQEAKTHGFEIEKGEKQKHYKINLKGVQYEIYFNGNLSDLQNKIVDPESLVVEYDIAKKKGGQKSKDKSQNQKNQESLEHLSKSKKKKQPSQQVRDVVSSYKKRFIVFFENGANVQLTREGDFPSGFSIAQAQEKFPDRGTVVNVKPVTSFE